MALLNAGTAASTSRRVGTGWRESVMAPTLGGPWPDRRADRGRPIWSNLSQSARAALTFSRSVSGLSGVPPCPAIQS